MAATILPQDLDTTSAETSPTPTPVRSHAALLGWVLVAVSLALATVLAVRALASDGDAARVPWFSVEHGSIAAIDQAAEHEARNQTFAVETGGIAAIDHAAAAPLPWYSVEHGSIAAADHATDDSPGDR